MAARTAAFALFRSLSAAGKATPLSHRRLDDILRTYRLKPLPDEQRAEIVSALEQQLKV